MTRAIPTPFRATDQAMLFRSLLFAAVLVGFAVGGAITLVQLFTTVPLIQQGEKYEAAAHVAAAPAGHDHGVSAWEPKDGLERTGFTALANILTATGFGLVLASLFALQGRAVGWREGLLWGLAGFAAVSLAPGLGLPPELPGAPAADLASRQIWWAGAVAATAAGLALLLLNRAPWAAVLGVLLLALPHALGAPAPLEAHAAAPEALSRQFVSAALLTSLIFWTLLGSVTALVQNRWFPASI